MQAPPPDATKKTSDPMEAQMDLLKDGKMYRSYSLYELCL